MAHNVLSYGSPEAARRANRAINKVAQDGGFVGVKPTERRVHTAVTSQTAATSSSEYNGYFKIVDSSIVNEDGTKTYRVRVVDGNTYDPDTQLSGPSVLHFNGEYKNIVPYEADVIQGFANYVYLICNAKECYITVSKAILSDSDSALARLIGRVSLKADNEMAIQQDFTQGIFYITPQVYAGDFSSYIDRDTNELVVQGGIVYAGSNTVSVSAKRFKIGDTLTTVSIRIYNNNGVLQGELVDVITDTRSNWYTPVLQYHKRDTYAEGLDITQFITFGSNVRINDRWL